MQEKNAKVSGISLDREAAEVFVEGVWELGFTVQRMGILYGTISNDDQDNSWIYVDAIYEPPQQPISISHSRFESPDKLASKQSQSQPATTTESQNLTTSKAEILKDDEYLKEQENVDTITSLLGLTKVLKTTSLEKLFFL